MHTILCSCATEIWDFHTAWEAGVRVALLAQDDGNVFVDSNEVPSGLQTQWGQSCGAGGLGEVTEIRLPEQKASHSKPKPP